MNKELYCCKHSIEQYSAFFIKTEVCSYCKSFKFYIDIYYNKAIYNIRGTQKRHYFLVNREHWQQS